MRTDLHTWLLSHLTELISLWKKCGLQEKYCDSWWLWRWSASSDCNGSKLNRNCQSFNFRNLISRPTRIAASSSTLLNLIFTNNFPKLFASGIFDYSIADHKFVFAIFMLKKHNEQPILKKVYSYKKLIENEADFKHELETLLGGFALYLTI